MVEIGKLVANHYHILAHIGSQGYIQRYAAQRIGGGEVIILASDPPSASHLTKVVDILRVASHPSLPPVLETWEEDETTFAVLDVPQGTPITEKWQNPSISDQQRLTWLIELCHALEVLRAAGAIFTALPPEGVIVVDDRVILADPSVIHAVPVQIERLTPNHYIPPELFADPSQISGRANVYPIGTFLASLFIGRLLRDEDMTEDSLRPIREVLPVTLSTRQNRKCATLVGSFFP